jgi:succinate dehydrogenase / fumarate reductase membrane anchor subunit
MVLFTVVLIAQLLFGGPVGYDRWAGIFAAPWMKAFTFVVVVALAYHAWVGCATSDDYVRRSASGWRWIFLVWLAAAGGAAGAWALT